MKIAKFLLSGLLGVLGIVSTLLFEPNVFRGITVPLTARALGWKAKAEVARLSPFGKLEIQGLEAVDPQKSRLALDSSLLVVKLESLLSGKLEIVQLDLKFGLIDLEMSQPQPSSGPIQFPLVLQEASIEITEGRVRLAQGAWILGGVEVKAQGWDGRTPREIRAKLQRLDWNGPGQEEICGSVSMKASKSAGAAGGDQWDANLSADVATVVDFSPAELVVPCRLVLDGRATATPSGDWNVESMRGSWEGVGGVKLAASATGRWAASGDWASEVQLDPVNLGIAGMLLQARGVKSSAGNLGGTLSLQGGKKKPVTARVNLQGQNVQIQPSIGPAWPGKPADFAASIAGAWTGEDGSLRVETLQASLGQKGQPQDLQMSLDRPAVFHPKGGGPASSEAAVLQWSLRGMEMAAVAPLVISPQQLKVQGGQLSASGRADIQSSTINVTGRIESRAMNASGSLLQGNLQITSAAIDFRGNLQGSEKIKVEEAVLTADWEGGVTNDVQAKIQAEWDLGKGEGWLIGGAEAGLIGLGKAWSGAKLWPEAGQAKVHLEFSGNTSDKGSGLFSITLQNMHWAGETASPWQAKVSSEMKNLAGVWSLPEIALQSDRGGQTLLDGQGSVEWIPEKGEGRAKVDLRKAESSLVVPILSILTPSWQWKEASGTGSFQYDRHAQQDRADVNLHGVITVETGLPGHSRLVDFSSVDGSVRASWPSAVSGKFSVDAFSLQALHRDGSDAIRASLDKPLLLEKIAEGEWQLAGKEAISGVMQFTGWPIGLFGPLIFPKATETSLLGSISGFLKVRGNPQTGVLTGEVDLQSPDLMVTLPKIQFPANQVSLLAGISLGADRQVKIQKVQLTSRQGAHSWLEFSAEKDAHSALAVVGKMDLATASQNFVGLADWVSGGVLVCKAEVADLKEGIRKIGYSTEITQFSGKLSEIGAITGVGVKSQGIVEWQDGLRSLSEVQLNASGAMGNISVSKFSWTKTGPFSWECGRISDGWMRILSTPWLRPAQWVDGDLVLGAGFLQTGNHGASGEFDLTLLEARLMEDIKLPAASVRVGGDFEYDRRTDSLTLKDASLLFPDYRNNPVEIPTMSWSPGSISAQLKGGVIDLRGLLAQTKGLLSAKPDPKASPSKSNPKRMDLSVDVDQIIVDEATVGPVKVPHFRFGPEGIILEPSTVQVKGGSISASVVSSATGQPVQARVVMNKFPLGAILGSMITDAKGPIGGWIDLQLSAQAAGPTIEELRRSLSGQGSFRLYQAHLERLPSMSKALQSAGQLLGSSFIASSEINDLGSEFNLQGEKISVPNLQVTGTAISASLNGWLNWFSQTLDFKLRFALTKEAMQSSGQLQGAMTQLIGKSNDYYTKIPGDARISGTLSDPNVEMNIGKMLAESGINLLMNAPSGILQGANGATGGAASPVTAPLQGALKIFGF
ncbi:MAG: hypothetical protein NTZ01_08515 [Verrucomicrobia bacterium]|nr:hypothetical protein [Verrucomicrobiota bacterium]